MLGTARERVTTSTIAAVEAIPFRIPLRRAVTFAKGTLTTADHILVRVRDSDGAVGLAEAIPRPMMYGETVGTMLAVYEEEIRPRVLGESIWHEERVARRLDGLVGNISAKAAFELALADLRCRRLGISCHRYLGGYVDKVQVSAILGYGPPEEVAAEAVEWREAQGVSAFKVKVGLDLPRDLVTCRLVREAVGDAALIYVDANRGFDVLDAVRFGQEAEAYGVAWIEEPSTAERILDRRRIAVEGGLPILGDESVASPAEVAREVLAGRTHLVSLKVSRSGYRVADQIRGFCETAGVPIIMGSQGDSGVGTLSILPYAAAHQSTAQYPTEYGYFLHLADDLLAVPLTISRGCLEVPAGPGAGIEIDETKLDHYRIR